MERNIKGWLKEICRGNRLDPFLEIETDEGEGNGEYGEYKFKGHLYTYEHKYTIVAIDRNDSGYLGCVVSTRKPRAGEDWTRGNDLPDGSYSYETWLKIKNAIIAYELVPLFSRFCTSVPSRQKVRYNPDEPDISVEAPENVVQINT